MSLQQSKLNLLSLFRTVSKTKMYLLKQTTTTKNKNKVLHIHFFQIKDEQYSLVKVSNKISKVDVELSDLLPMLTHMKRQLQNLIQ